MQKIVIQVMVVIFVKSNNILFEKIINIIEKYFFAYLLITKVEKNITKKIILSICKDNI